MGLKVISTKTAEHYSWGQDCDGWFLLKRADVNVIRERMPSGAAEVMHLHRKSTQLFYVLRGTLTMAGESSSTMISAGQALVIEPNVQHRATNESDGDVEFLVISCPPSHGDRFDCEARN
jgi:mannose-6-phosphate isomerase-like protein (cupin superfamily)